MKKRFLFLGIGGILIVVFLVMFLLNFGENVGGANPASVYCVEQGGRVDIREAGKGQIGYCVFENFECEEWSFYRGECALDKNEKCVPDSCCHASGCVLEDDAPNCSGAICTMECRGRTMDCGAGYCAFVDGKCGVVWNE